MRSYVVRMQDTGADIGEPRGVVEAVATGERTTFRSVAELIHALGSGHASGVEGSRNPGAADLDPVERCDGLSG